MPLDALPYLPCLPLPAPPRSDPQQTNNKALHHTANQQQSIASHKDPQIPQSKPTIPPIPTIRTNQQPSSSLEQRSIFFLRPPICHKPPTTNFYNLETAPHLPWVSSSPWSQIPQSKPTNEAYSPIQTKPTFIFFSSIHTQLSNSHSS